MVPTIDIRCNRVEFLGDVTIADNAVLHVGEGFTKTWRVKNAGACAWGAGYKLVFVQGDRMGGAESSPLPAEVAPSQTVDISISLAAPSAPGQYQGFWQLQTPDGRNFGIGSGAAGNLWVKIRAIATGPTLPSPLPTRAATLGAPTATPRSSATSAVAIPSTAAASPSPAVVRSPTSIPSLLVDLAGTACAAEWQSNDGILQCPGQDGEARGFVLLMKQAKLEDGTTTSLPTLLTFPSSSKDGYILGLYPQYSVLSGDHFQASVGCEGNALACSVLFRLSYLDSSGAAHDLWSLGEFYDGKYFNLDLDLAALAGQQVRLVLSVNSLSSAVGDRALWVAPRIVHYPGGAAATASPAAPLPIISITPSRTSTPAPTSTVAAPAPVTPTPAQTNGGPSLSRVFENIISFFKQLFSGK